MLNGSKPSRTFDAVFIDFYGTISAGDRAAVVAACEELVRAFRLDLTAEGLAIRWGERFFHCVDQSNRHAFRSLYECECASLLDTLSPLVGPFDPHPFVAVLETYWRNPPLHPDAKHLLDRLDLPVCCISNADAVPLAAAIEKHGLRFDAVISSQASRCYKPDAEIFRTAAAALGVDPRNVIHVGDSLHSDVAGAAKLGITSAWICRSERIHDIGTLQPRYTISSLTELLDILS